ncbi:branched-chain amino acid:cation transporter, LIVCS family [Lachnospiraceae bacterium XBB1006]|nr:branched-chain amino acid:cation transporter, LIVCS family [Lachnospiraceae bacterium XBB1006]
MKSKITSTFVVGFAVFAMLFGAGNLVFPPFLGMQSGENWIWGFLGFAVMDVVLAVVVMNVIASKKDGADGIVGILGKKLSTVLMLALYICIGPLVAIPRTAATTYELSIAPLLPQFNSVAFSIVFFAVVLVLCIRPSKIIDIIGAVLAPILLVTLGVLIVKGIIHPLGSISGGGALYTSVHTGITTGYQTMDAIAALAFSILIIAQVRDYKLKNKAEERKMIRHACYIAGIALILIYGGLAYLGASVRGIYPKDISRTDIIINLAKDILGPAGLVVLAVIVAAACLTTAIGLVSSCAAYLEKLANGKVSYKVFCTGACVFSAVLCNVGLDNIIALAAPILDFIYPILLVLVFLATMKESVVSTKARYGTIAGVVAFVVLQLIENLTHVSAITAHMPLATYGFAWITPAIVGMVIGMIVGKLVPAREAMGYGN